MRADVGPRAGGGADTVIIRNHERGIGTAIQAPGMYDTSRIRDGAAGGGTAVAAN